MSLAAGLTPAQLAALDEHGYLVVPDALPPAAVAECLAETRALLDGFALDEHPLTRFSTGEGGAQHVGDDYFLRSGDKVRFFFEQDAFDAAGQLAKPKARAINKMGHSLHTLSAPFRRVSLSRANAAVAASLGFRDPRLLQSMVICKQPEIGGVVPPHQDSTFLYTDPPSAVGWWYALEDADRHNGCLSFLPGSHRREGVALRFVKLGGGGTGFVDNAGTRFPAGHVHGEETRAEHPDTAYTLAEVKAGTLVLIHGNLLHKSERNTSGKSRFIYTFHVIEGEHHYDDRNWLQPTADGFSSLKQDVC